jgi:hypothetical protein
MNRSVSRKIVASALGAAAALGVVTAAQAHTDVSFSIGFPIGPAYVESAPVYVQPRPVYVEPRPVYMEPRPVYVEPRPIYVQPRPVVVAPPTYVYERGWYPSHRRFERERDWRQEWRRREWDERKHHWDPSPGRGWD